MKLAILAGLGLLLAGCATAPAPEACYRTLSGELPFQKDQAWKDWWNSQCLGRMGGGGTISHGEVAPLRFHYERGGLQTY